MNLSPLIPWYTLASVQGSPSPKNTLTLLLPVTFPIAASAVLSYTAAILEAKVSGTEVPRATKVRPVTASFSPMQHPNIKAKSATTAVSSPMNIKETTKATLPLSQLGGGITARNTFQWTIKKWKKYSQHPGSSSGFSGKLSAFLN